MMVCGQHGSQWIRILLPSLLAAIVFFGSLAFGMPGRLAFNKCRETVDRHVVPDDGSPACNKFIVLTTQRSGSTWFCEALGHQPEVFCLFRNEMLMNKFQPKTGPNQPTKRSIQPASKHGRKAK